MSELTNEYYIKELSELKTKMLNAESMARKFPYFSKYILNNKITGLQGSKIGEKYKDVYFGWGVYRSYHESSERLTNYKSKNEPINKYLSNIYINTLCLYDSHEKLGLFDLENKCSIYYTDYTNSTFYVEDEHLENFLEELNKWYLEAREKVKEAKKEEKRKQLERQLEELNN